MRPRAAVRLICAAAALATAWTAALAAEPLQLRARWLELRDGQLRAEGDVRLSQQACELEASSLELELRSKLIFAEHVRLRAGNLVLKAVRLRWEADGALRARWPRLWLCGCPERKSSWLSLGAHSARVTPDGRRLHLRWPALWLGSRRVLTVPYLALPLRRGVSGLLLPELSWSDRDGVRLEQAGYLAGSAEDLLLAAGWIQHRGAWGRLRAALLRDGWTAAELALAGLRDGERWRGSLQGRAWLGSSRLGGGLHADLVSDQAWPAQLDRDADRVFSPYLRSRLWAGATGGPFAVTGSLDFWQELAVPARQSERLRLGQARLLLDLLPVQLLGPFSLQAQLGAESSPAALGEGESAPWLTELRFSPRLALASAAGPLQVSGLLGYLFQTRWFRGAQPSSAGSNEHGLLGLLEAGLPLVRRFGGVHGLVHQLEPFAGARLAHFFSAPLDYPGIDRQTGSLVTLGLRTALLARPARQSLRRWASAELRLEVPLGDSPELLPETTLLSVEAQLRWSGLGSLRGEWRGWLRSQETAALRGEGCLGGGSIPLELCGGVLRLRQLRVEDLLGIAGLAWPIHDPLVRLDSQTVLDQVFVAAAVHHGPLTAWARLAVDPLASRLNQGSYGLRLELHCGWVRLELSGVSRAGQRWPDLVARLGLGPGGTALACLSAPSPLEP